MSILEQLKARLDEDGRIALSASKPTGTWSADGGELYATFGLDRPERCGEHPAGIPNPCDDSQLASFEDDFGGDSEANATHAARQDPKRTLAMVQAHQEILELHYEIWTSWQPDQGEEDQMHLCGHCEVQYPCQTLILLARGYGIEVQ